MSLSLSLSITLSLSLSLPLSPSFSLTRSLSLPRSTLQRSHHSKGTRGVHETHSRRAGPTRNVMRVGKNVVWSRFFSFFLLLLHLLVLVSSPLRLCASASSSRVSLNTCATARSLAHSLARSLEGRRSLARDSSYSS